MTYSLSSFIPRLSMRRVLPPLLGISLILFFSAILLNKFQTASAATATNIVISEIQANGAITSEDFIELYNPTSSDINLGDMRLVKRTADGATDTDIVVFLAADVIKAHGYYLWCNTSLSSTLTCDKTSTDTVSNNNSVGLRNEPANTGALVDAVSFGTVTNTLGEGTSLTVPTASTSVERKANPSSNNSSMGSGGVDEFMGNAEDTNNNTSDFVGRATPQPQNSTSAAEPIGTPSVTPSLTPTVTLIPTNSPSPTQIPSVTPSPTLIPSTTPSPTTAPSVSPSPTTIPSVTVSPTSIPSPTPIPSISPPPPIPTPKVIFSGSNFVCALHYRPLKFFNKIIFIPFARCTYP